MIVFLKGTLEEILENYIVVDCNGIGYSVGVSALTISNLPNKGDTIKIHTYMNVKEDGISLYGFLHQDELDMFNMLISVSGVGPKVSLGVLSTFSPSKIMFAIVSEDVETLAKAPGLGKKTASRLCLELKDKVKTRDAISKSMADSQQDLSGSVGNKQEAIEALLALGYSKSEAIKAVMEVALEGMSTNEVIKLALKKLVAF